MSTQPSSPSYFSEPDSPSLLDLAPTETETEQPPDSETLTQHDEVSNTFDPIADEASNSSVNAAPPWQPQINILMENVDESDATSDTQNLDLSPTDENSNASTVQNPTANEPVSFSSYYMAVQYINEHSSDTVQSHSEPMSMDRNVCRPEDGELEPPSKQPRLASPKPEADDQDGETCPICLDVWGNSGDHRLVALKCGHLFGHECVQRWLKGQPAKDRACPTCKARATVRDIRFIYARKLIAADTAEVTTLQRHIDTLQSEKNRVELELHKSKIAHKSCLRQLEELKSRAVRPPDEHDGKEWRFALDKNLEIAKDGGCRVLTYNCRSYELLVSQKSTNGLFPGYGVRRVSCVDYRPGQFLFLHPKPIRDMAYSQPRDLLLSVSLDGTARLVERGAARASVQCGLQLWACAWDALDENCFHAGGVGGAVLQYDVRNARAPLRRRAAPGDVSPVVALRSTRFGLLSCQLNSSWLWPAAGEPRALPLEGPFMSLAYDEEGQRALVCCRPGAAGRARLHLCRLSGDGDDVRCEPDQVFWGSARASVMSRACVARAGRAAWAAAHSESDAALRLYGAGGGARGAALPAAEPALDLCAARAGGRALLAALSQGRLRVYRAVPTDLSK